MPDPSYHYTALVHDDGRIEYAEHYEDEAVARTRASQLESEAIIRGEAAGWRVYLGPEPYEAVKARADYLIAHPTASGATSEERDEIVELADMAATDAYTISALTAPPVDDRPEWYKAGYPSQAAYEKAHQKEDEDA